MASLGSHRGETIGAAEAREVGPARERSGEVLVARVNAGVDNGDPNTRSASDFPRIGDAVILQPLLPLTNLLSKHQRVLHCHAWNPQQGTNECENQQTRSVPAA